MNKDYHEGFTREAYAKAINNYVRANGYSEALPALEFDPGRGDVSNMDIFQAVATGAEFSPKFNSFAAGFLQLVSALMIQNNEINNPLNLFKKNSLMAGATMQISFTNPAQRIGNLELTAENNLNSFGVYKPDIKVSYLTVNRGKDGLGLGDVYAATIQRIQFKQAFLSLDNLDGVVQTIVQSIAARNLIDEYTYIANIFSASVSENKVVTRQVAGSPLTVRDDLETLLTTMQVDFENMTAPTPDYNAYLRFNADDFRAAIHGSRKENQIVVMSNELRGRINVAWFSTVFGPQYTETGGRVVSVPQRFLGAGIYGGIVELDWIQFRDQTVDFDNTGTTMGATGAINFFMRLTGIVSVLPTANAVIYITPAIAPSIAATAINTSTDAATTGQEIGYQFDPANATDQIVVVDTANSNAVVTSGYTLDVGAHTIAFSAAGTYALKSESSSVISATLTITAAP